MTDRSPSAAPEGQAWPDPGSFRDPTNRVLFVDGEVFRGLDSQAKTAFERLSGSELYRRAQDSGRIVSTELVDPPPTELSRLGWEAALSHERIPIISYPYEWTFGMLRDAAVLELDLTLEALADGLITKDATPYNVQFVGSRPIHIDVGSFEPLGQGEPWFGYRQFCQQFLYPLLLTARRGIHHQKLLRGSLRGITPEECVALLRWRDLIRRGTFTHVLLHAQAERRRTPRDPATVRSELKAAGLGAKVLEAQLRGLRRLVTGLRRPSVDTVWSGYSQRGHYVEHDLAVKRAFVERAVSRRPRTQVLDLGANDGAFSELAARHAKSVVATDRDPVVVDRLYEQLAAEGATGILPLVMDLTDLPSGAGWRGRERTAFLTRLAPDLVLCLALVHHLVITESIPIDEVVGFLAEFKAPVLLELPRPDDPMVEVLAAQKKDPREALSRYSLGEFESALSMRFRVAERLEVGSRVLLELHPTRASHGAP